MSQMNKKRLNIFFLRILSINTHILTLKERDKERVCMHVRAGRWTIDKETNRGYLEKEGTTEKGWHCKRVIM